MQLGDRLKPSITALLVLLVVCSSAASVTALAGTTATPPASTAPSTDVTAATYADNDSDESAAEIYVHENGDAVLVYDDSESDEDEDDDPSTATGHLGLDVGDGLMHVLVRDDLDEETNVTGDASVVLTPDSLAGNGSFQAPRPDTLENLDVSIDAERSETDMFARASFDMLYVDEDAASSTSMLESAETSGDVTTTADAFSTTGSANVELAQDLGMVQHREYTLTEGTNQYLLEASEEYMVSSYLTERWDTKANATKTLEAQYASIATALGGSADVTVQSHSFTETANGQYTLDIEYQIVYSNIDDALAQRIAQSITSDEDADVSPETAEAVGDAVANLEIDRVHASLDAEGTTVQSSWDVQISNYDDLVRASFDLFEETTEDENVTEQLEDARKNYEAMQAANLEQTFSWDVSMTSPSEGAVQVSGSMEYTTANYEAYVTELEARDVPTQGTMTFSASAQTDGEEVVAEMSYSVEQEDLVDSTLDSLMSSASQSESGPESTQRFIEAFQRSDFEKAKMDVSVEEDSVRFEAGASFENMSSFQSVMADEFGGDVTSMYADITPEGEESKAYVRVSGAFGENATESEVREHQEVDEDTEIHLAGEWNASETTFPEMDTAEARNYLGIEAPDNGSTNGTTSAGDDSGGLPGFGMPAAFAAVAAVSALLLGRLQRRED